MIARENERLIPKDKNEVIKDARAFILDEHDPLIEDSVDGTKASFYSGIFGKLHVSNTTKNNIFPLMIVLNIAKTTKGWWDYLINTNNKNIAKTAEMGLSWVTLGFDLTAITLLLLGFATIGLSALVGLSAFGFVLSMGRGLYHATKMARLAYNNQSFTEEYKHHKQALIGNLIGAGIVGLLGTVFTVAFFMPLVVGIPVAAGVVHGIATAASAVFAAWGLHKLATPAKRFVNWVTEKLPRLKPGLESVKTTVNSIGETVAAQSKKTWLAFESFFRRKPISALEKEKSQQVQEKAEKLKNLYKEGGFNTLEFHHDDLIKRLRFIKEEESQAKPVVVKEAKPINANNKYILDVLRKNEEEAERYEKANPPSKRFVLNLIREEEYRIGMTTREYNDLQPGTKLLSFKSKDDRPGTEYIDRTEKELIKIKALSDLERLINSEERSIKVKYSKESAEEKEPVTSMTQLLGFFAKNRLTETIFKSGLEEVGGMQKVFVVAHEYLRMTEEQDAGNPIPAERQAYSING